MHYAIVCSIKDLAGVNIRDVLLKKGFSAHLPFRKGVTSRRIFGTDDATIYTLETDTVASEGLADEIPADKFIFISRHQSKSGDKTLSVHFPGNLGKADFGGRDRKLCMADPHLLKKAFLHLYELGNGSGYQVTLEATHHGPLMKKPVFFIEIGSTPEQWNDRSAAEVIAETVVRAIGMSEDRDGLKSLTPPVGPVAICFGGSHYCSAFNEIERKTDISLSHICPKYSLDSMDHELVSEMISSTSCRVDYALLDWNGLTSDDKSKLIGIFADIGLPWKKTKDVKPRTAL